MSYSPIEDRYLSTLTRQEFPDAPPAEPSIDGMQLAEVGATKMADYGYSGQRQATMTDYDPTVRERMADFLQAGFEKFGMDRYKARQQAQTLIGGPSSNLPLNTGLADIVPFLGTALQTQEAARMGEESITSAQQGNIGTAALQAGGAVVGMIPGVAGTVKAGKALAPKAGEMVVNATEKTGVPVRGLGIVEPDGKVMPTLPVDKVQRQKNYKTWAEGADIKADDGKPKTLYHATTHDFDTFSLQRANAENHYGKAFYLTDSVDDANANYAGVGPDLKQRIELRSERLADEFADMDEQDVMDTIKSAGVDMKKYFSDGKTFADLDSKQTSEVLMQVAEKELKGHDGMVMPVFAKMKNPVKVGTKDETVFSIETQFDDAGDVIDESGNGIDLINAIREVGDEYSVDVEDAITKIAEDMYDGIRAGDVDRIMRENIYEVYTPDGEMAGPGQFIADVFQRMGFDGIEMNAEKYFGPRQGAWGGKITGMDGVKGANHYILFDSKNIKSAIGNNGKFDPRDPNILHGATGIGAGTGAATMQDKEKN